MYSRAARSPQSWLGTGQRRVLQSLRRPGRQLGSHGQLGTTTANLLVGDAGGRASHPTGRRSTDTRTRGDTTPTGAERTRRTAPTRRAAATRYCRRHRATYRPAAGRRAYPGTPLPAAAGSAHRPPRTLQQPDTHSITAAPHTAGENTHTTVCRTHTPGPKYSMNRAAARYRPARAQFTYSRLLAARSSGQASPAN